MSATRSYTPRELRWVTEYVQQKYPGMIEAGKVVFQMPLGPLAYGIYMRAADRADAVILEGDTLTILEADAENINTALGQLLRYLDLVELTPSLVDKQFKSIKGALLLPRPSPSYEAFAAKYNITVDYYLPDWFKEYLNTNRRRAFE